MLCVCLVWWPGQVGQSLSSLCVWVRWCDRAVSQVWHPLPFQFTAVSGWVRHRHEDVSATGGCDCGVAGGVCIVWCAGAGGGVAVTVDLVMVCAAGFGTNANLPQLRHWRIVSPCLPVLSMTSGDWHV